MIAINICFGLLLALVSIFALHRLYRIRMGQHISQVTDHRQCADHAAQSHLGVRHVAYNAEGRCLSRELRLCASLFFGFLVSGFSCV